MYENSKFPSGMGTFFKSQHSIVGMLALQRFNAAVLENLSAAAQRAVL
jgi:hypothetical protein